jgi:hypothetical protein
LSFVFENGYWNLFSRVSTMLSHLLRLEAFSDVLGEVIDDFHHVVEQKVDAENHEGEDDGS